MLKNVLIGATGSYTTAVSPNLLTSGQIGVYKFDATSTVTNGYTLLTGAITAADAKFPIVIAQGVPAGQNFRQFVIQPGQKKAYLNTTYVAPIPNVYNIGFDGTTYDLVSGAAGTYGFNVKNTTLGNPPFPVLSSTPYYNTAAAATSIAIATEAVKDFNFRTLNASVDVMPQNRFAIAEVLSNAATAATTSTPTATVVNGSPTVVLSATSVDAVVGNYWRFGSATLKTYAIYKIIAVSGTTLTLEMPYVNPSVAIGASIAGLVTGFVIPATVAASAAGIRMTETGNVFNGSNVLEPQPNKTLSVSCSVNASGTPVQNNGIVAKSYTLSTGLVGSGVYTEGVGTYPQVFKKELTAAGYGGYINRTFLPDNFPIYSASANTYDIIGLQFLAPAKDFTGQGFTFGEPLEAIIACTAGAAQFGTLGTILGSANW